MEAAKTNRLQTQVTELASAMSEMRRHVDGLRYLASRGRVGTEDPTLSAAPAPNPAPPTSASPTSVVEPPASAANVYSIVNYKLAVNGVVQEDTNGVVQLGTLEGYTLVHKNSGGDWYGKSSTDTWTHLNDKSVKAVGTELPPPAVVVTPEAPAPAPAPSVREKLSIIEGQLAVAGKVLTETSNVIQVGTAKSYTQVHLNTSNEWFGVNALGKWELISASLVTPIGDRVELVVKPIEVSGSKARWARKYPTASAKYSRGTPPGKIKRTLYNYTEAPLWIDPHFSGMHIQKGVPQWIRDETPQAAIIPAPTYPYGYFRTLHGNGNEADDPTFWWQVEKVKGQYYWDDFDALMKSVPDTHPVILPAYGTPTFYQKYPGERSKWPHWFGLASPPKDGEGMLAFEKFIRAVYDRYGTRIMGVETWNEPNFWGMQQNSRWTPSITANRGAPFFSGTPVDLAKMQLANYNALRGTSALALSPAFTDEYKSAEHSQAQVFFNTDTGQGQAKKYTEGLAVHHYDYDKTDDAVTQMMGYRDLLKRVGLNVDIYNTEVGAEARAVFTSADAATRAPKRITYWGFTMAALGFRSSIFYGHLNKAGRMKHLGDTVSTQSVIHALTLVNSIGGKVLREAAELTDGRIWLRFDDNTEVTSL